MKLSSLIFLLAIISSSALAQESPENHNWYKYQRPEFSGGQKGFEKYIFENVKIKNKKLVLEKFLAEFKIDVNRNIQLVRQYDSVNSPEFNKTIIENIMKSNHKWLNGSLNEKPVDSKVIISINFQSTVAGGHEIYMIQTLYTPVISSELANQYYNEGVKMFEQKNYEEAIKFFDETLYLTSKDIDALYNRGVCKFKMGDKTGACEDWNKIKSLDKPDADNLLSKYCSN